MILLEIKANGSRLDGITSHLEVIANSSLQNSFTALSERVTGAKSRLEEAERRISSAKDSATTMERQVINLKMMVDQPGKQGQIQEPEDCGTAGESGGCRPTRIVSSRDDPKVVRSTCSVSGT